MESYETDLMDETDAACFSLWFDKNIGTDCYKYGSGSRCYFVCLDLIPSEVEKIDRYLKGGD